MTNTPYKNQAEDDWLSITHGLVRNFPITKEKIVEIVVTSWDDFYSSKIGLTELAIGRDIFIPAQATGVILEKIIASKLSRHNPKIWVGGTEKNHKDIENLEDSQFSFEIKTSSSQNGVYGNRSTGFRSGSSKKVRSGYYLVVNYLLPTESEPERKIRKIRFGWIDDDDWVGQKQSSGQQASIGSKLAKLKLIPIFES